MESLSTPATAVGEFADAAMNHAVAAMRRGWLVSRGCVLDIDDGPFSARVQYALLHAHVGIVLLDVVPAATLNAADRLRQRFDSMGFGAKFGRNPPILYFCVPLRAISDIGYLLEQEFGQQPSSALPSDDGWVTTAQDMLSAKPVEGSGSEVHLAGTSDHVRRHHSRNLTSVAQGRDSGWLSGGARLLAVFWGLVILSLGGGAMCLQYLGPPAERTHSVGTMDLGLASATDTFPATAFPLNQPGQAGDALLNPISPVQAASARSVAGAKIEAPSLIADAQGAINADTGRDLIENEQAVIKLQERLKRFEHAPEKDDDPSLTTPGTPPDYSPMMPAMQHENNAYGAVSTTPAEMTTTLPAQAPQLIIADVPPKPHTETLQAATTSVTADGLPAEDAPAKTPLPSEVESQAPARRDGDTIPFNAEYGVAAIPGLPSLTSAEAPTGPAKSTSTIRPDEFGDAFTSNVANTVPSSAMRSASTVMANIMLRRGDALLQRGDVSAARLLYNRVAVSGSGPAATAMGKTFDAPYLMEIGVTSLVADPVLAATWYRRALDLGDEEARIRLQAMSRSTLGSGTTQERRP